MRAYYSRPGDNAPRKKTSLPPLIDSGALCFRWQVSSVELLQHIGNVMYWQEPLVFQRVSDVFASSDPPFDARPTPLA